MKLDFTEPQPIKIISAEPIDSEYNVCVTYLICQYTFRFV